MYRSLVTAGSRLGYAADPNRGVWLQVVRGQARVNGHDLVEEQGLAVNAISEIDIMGVTDEADDIVIDLA